jgi:hypothetical protein
MCLNQEQTDRIVKFKLIHTLMDTSLRNQDIYMFFLLGIDEDLDEDLLM